jgi:hypothetical protein
VAIENLAGVGRQETESHAMRRTCGLDFLVRGLIGTFSIGPITDDRLEACLRDERYLVQLDLRGDAQSVIDFFKVHGNTKRVNSRADFRWFSPLSRPHYPVLARADLRILTTGL